MGALHFFLAVNDSSETAEGDSSGDESDEETSKALRTVAVSKQMTKKGKKRERKLSKALHKIKVSRMLTLTQGSLSSLGREPGTHCLHMHQNPVSSDIYYREMCTDMYFLIYPLHNFYYAFTSKCQFLSTVALNVCIIFCYSQC